MKRNNQNRGFTIVELLTVMGIIALLIGLLVPALTAVRKTARDVKQKAQFHSISVALEMFKNDIGDYPDSSFLPTGGTSDLVCGANRLAEALVGRDLQGYDPVSRWHPTEDATYVTNAYSTNTGGNPSLQQQSLERRKGPYLNLQGVGAFSACQFFQTANTGPLYPGYDLNLNSGGKPAPMLSDIYTTKNVQLTVQTTTGNITTTAKAGLPVLYFKANPSATELNYVEPDNSFYNYKDNMPIFNYCQSLAPTKSHPFADLDQSGHWEPFYNKITNPAATTGATVNALRPYNQDSFILLSAGNDAIYGTSDDIWNFGD
jgi:prepilin-type N-terminal cleavage/methylation domain-containing protein